MPEKKIGEVFHYYDKIGVAAIKLSGELKVGDTIHIKGKVTDFKQKVSSMQIEGKAVSSAKKSGEVGLKVDSSVKAKDEIFKA